MQKLQEELLILMSIENNILVEFVPLLIHVDDTIETVKRKLLTILMDEFSFEEIYAPVNLGIGKCRMSVAEPLKLAVNDDPKSWSHVKVATKYPKITKNYFAEKGVQAECLKLNGALEIAPMLGLTKRIVDLVSSGKTLKENGLTEVGKIMDVSSYLIVNRNFSKSRPEKIKTIIEKFRRVADAKIS